MTLNAALQSIGYDPANYVRSHYFRAMSRTMLAKRFNQPQNVIEHQLVHKISNVLGIP